VELAECLALYLSFWHQSGPENAMTFLLGHILQNNDRHLLNTFRKVSTAHISEVNLLENILESTGCI
jgi:hypothetical protein